MGQPSKSAQKKRDEKNIQLIIQECQRRGLTKEQTAYILATVEHETGGTFRGDSYEAEHATQTGDAYRRNQPYFPYYGRSFPHLTHKENYQWASEQVGYDLVKDPDALLKRPDWGARLLVQGMMEGRYGRPLTEYVNKDKKDYAGARNSVNSRDDKTRQPIANYANNWERTLTNTGYNPNNKAPGFVSGQEQPSGRQVTPRGQGMLSAY